MSKREPTAIKRKLRIYYCHWSISTPTGQTVEESAIVCPVNDDHFTVLSRLHKII